MSSQQTLSMKRVVCTLKSENWHIIAVLCYASAFDLYFILKMDDFFFKLTWKLYKILLIHVSQRIAYDNIYYSKVYASTECLI